MVSSSFVRHGLAAITGGSLFWVITPITLASGDLSYHWITHLCQVFPILLLLISLLHIRKMPAKKANWLKISSFFLMFESMLLVIAVDLLQAFMLAAQLQGLPIFPVTEQLYLLGYLLWFVSSIAFGIAMVRAHVLPLGSSWLLIIGPVIVYLSFAVVSPFIPAFSVLILYFVFLVALTPWCIGWVWLGYNLWVHRFDTFTRVTVQASASSSEA